MAGLSSGLNIGLSGLQAAQSALDVIGHNISNVNTPGYSRQDVQLSSSPSLSYGGLQYGTGVTVTSISATRNKFLDMQITSAISGQAGAQTRYDGISAVSTAFQDDGKTGLASTVQAFFDGVSKLAGAPQDQAMRTNLVGTAQTMVSAFQSRYQMVSNQISSSDQQISDQVSQVNTLTTQIAALNVRIAAEQTPGSDSDARDQRANLVDQLGKVIGIQSYEDAKGQLNVTLDSGAGVLVASGTSNTLVATPDVTLGGHFRVDCQSSTSATNVTSSIKGGTLGGLIDLRDNILPGYQAQMDELAAGITGSVNLQSRAGFDLNGAAGVDLFQSGVANGANGLPPAITAASNYKGMVSAMSVSAAVAASPSLIAAASSANPGDNGNALAIAQLANATSTVDTNGDGAGDSGPFATSVAILNNKVGVDAQGYNNTVTNMENLSTALQGQRTSASAVSLDEEATKLLSFQRGYEASSRFINVISQLTDELVNGLGK